MKNYIANMDIQIDEKLFHESEQITAKIRDTDASFLLAHGMIRKQDDSEQVEPEKKVQESAEPEKKSRKQGKR